MSNKQLTFDDVIFYIEAEPEDMPIRGNAISSGDDKLDHKIENEIIEELNNGNDWVWCTIKVWAQFDCVESDAEYLGCCSYKNAEDFKNQQWTITEPDGTERTSNGYWDDMRKACLDNLQDKLERLESKLLDAARSIT